MTDLGLPEALRRRAEHAAPPPADLADLVEGRFRRRRRRRTGASALAVVGAVTAAALMASGLGDRPPTPADSPAPTSSAVVPSASPGDPDVVPFVLDVWPQLSVPLPATAPDGARPIAQRSIDATHVLVTTAPKRTVYSFDVTDGTFRKLLDDHLPNYNGLRVSATYLYLQVYLQQTKEVELHRMPLAGGRLVHLATLRSGTFRLWYATDDAVYGSNGTGDSSWKYDIATRTTTRIPGEAYADIDGNSPWSVRMKQVEPGGRPDRGEMPASLFNVVTGERREVARPAGVTQMACSPHLCVYADPSADPKHPRYYRQRLDGSERTPLTLPGSPSKGSWWGITAYDVGTLGMFLIGGMIYDPATGKGGGLDGPGDECGLNIRRYQLSINVKQDGTCKQSAIMLLLDRLR